MNPGLPRQATVRRRPRPVTFSAIALVVAILITAFVIALPSVRFAYRNPPLQVGLEVVVGMAGTLVAYLAYGRFRQRCQVTDLWLLYALWLLSLNNIFFSVLPRLLPGEPPQELSVWGRLILQIIAIASLAVSSIPRERVVERRAAWWTLAFGVVTLLATAGTVEALASFLPPGVEQFPAGASARPLIAGHPVVLAAQIVVMVLYMVAGAEFTRRAQLTEDELSKWIGAGCWVGAVSRLNYFLFPSLYTHYLYVGDGLRLAFYMFLLVGAFREIQEYWRRQAEASAYEERQRVARYLHDGLAQELVLVSGRAAALAREMDGRKPPAVERLETAATRSVAEARRAISALSEPAHTSLNAALERYAEDLTSNSATRLELQTDAHIFIAPERREDVLRIAREAILNSLRHGRADTIRMRLSAGDRIELSIEDDGRGFDMAAALASKGGFGLVSMRHKASLLGGEVDITSSPGEGTTVTLTVPRD